jgi:WD40 repeat protein
VSTLSVWDVDTGKEVSRLAARPRTSLLRYSPDGRLLAAGTHDGVVQLWDAGTGQRLGLSRARDCRLESLAFLPGRKVLAAGITEQSVCVWELPAGRDLTPRDAHPGTVGAIAFSRDGKAVVSAGADGVRVWDAATGRGLRHILPPGEEERRRYGTGGGRTQSLLSPGGRYLVCGNLGYDGMQVADLVGGEYVGDLEVHRHGLGVTGAFAADGTTFAALSRVPSADGRGAAVRIWDLSTGREVRSLKGALAEVQSSLAISPDGKVVAVAACLEGRKPSCEVRLWEVAGGKEV